MKIRLFGAVPDSIVDGPGLRYAVFLQGCSHGCKGCHNPESWDFSGGTETTVKAVLEDISKDPLVHNVTLTGGDPFDQAEPAAELARQLKAKNFGIWAYSGYLYEDLLANGTPAQKELLANVDVLVDGPFVESRKSLALDWRGSSNQRLIDLQAMRKTGDVHTIIEWQPPEPVLEDAKPPNW